MALLGENTLLRFRQTRVHNSGCEIAGFKLPCSFLGSTSISMLPVDEEKGE